MTTPIIVRAIASGGKFIGQLVGGFSVTLAIPGQNPIVFQSSGSSGNTVDLMQQQRLRTATLPTNSDTVEMPGSWAASAQTVVNISSPVNAQITVTGPGNFGSQQGIVTTNVWLIPGVGLQGDSKFNNGLVVEIPGLLIQNPTATNAQNRLTISAQVTMMCGCKIIDNNGIWISSDFAVTAQQLDGNGNVLAENPMKYVPLTSSNGTPSLFQTTMATVSGAVSVCILANQLSMANTGVALVAIR